MSTPCQVQRKQSRFEDYFVPEIFSETYQIKPKSPNEKLLHQIESIEKTFIKAIWTNNDAQNANLYAHLYKELKGLISSNQSTIMCDTPLKEKCREVETWLNRTYPTLFS